MTGDPDYESPFIVNGSQASRVVQRAEDVASTERLFLENCRKENAESSPFQQSTFDPVMDPPFNPNQNVLSISTILSDLDMDDFDNKATNNLSFVTVNLTDDICVVGNDIEMGLKYQ